MVFRPTDDALRLLRVTLQKLEHGLDAVHDAHVMAELKRMVLLRIAVLEAVNALQQHAGIETSDPTSSFGLSPHLVVTGGVPGEGTVDTNNLEDRSSRKDDAA
jgi:hypothetical protein